jgi:hypothetical protein
MSSRYSIKNTVKILSITKPNQKIRFQIRHPENVYAVTGISVTCSLAIDTDPKNAISDLAGHLVLAILNKGDVVYVEDVRVDNNNYSEHLEKNLIPSFAPQEQYLSGKGKFYFETFFKIKEGVLEGYYEDLFLKPPVLIIPIIGNTPITYQVKIYIRYQTLKTEQT